MSERSADVPTMDEFNALEARVTALEEAQSVAPPEPPVLPSSGSPRDKVLDTLRANTGNAWVMAQMCHSNLAEHNYNKGYNINAQMIMVDPWMDMQPESAWDASGIPALLSHAESGGWVGVSAFLPNPITGGGSMDKSGINPEEMLTPGSGQYNALMSRAERVMNLMKPLDDAGYPVFHRIFWEAEGNWFWWNANDMFSADQHKRLFKIWADYMRQHLKHVIICFASNGTSLDHYPAEARPDVAGFDGYTDHPENYKGHYDQLCALVAPGTPVIFAEFGSGNPGSGNPNYDSQHFVDTMRDVMPNLSMAMAWSGTDAGGWAWGRYQNPGALSCESVLQWGQC